MSVDQAAYMEASSTLNNSRIVNQRFFSVADQFGSRPALASRTGTIWEQWSYRRLADRALALASCLNSIGVAPGEAVGIIASRYPDTIAAMIATLEIGAHYIPLDPGYPDARLRLLCEDASVKCILSATPVSDPHRFPAIVHALDGLAVVDSPAVRQFAYPCASVPVFCFRKVRTDAYGQLWFVIID